MPSTEGAASAGDGLPAGGASSGDGAPPAAASRRPRVLVVDDEPDILATLQQAFEILLPDCDVVTATNAADGARAALEHDVDTLVTDFRMPGEDGLQLIENLQNAGKRCRTIVVTAYGVGEVEARARRLGVHEVFPKPFDIVQLVSAVRGERPTRRRPARP